jgi:HSP20 family protein
MQRRSSSHRRQDEGAGGILKGLGDLVEKLSELAEKGQSLSQTGEIKEGDRLRGMYGFTVKMGLGDRGPTIEPFGNIGRDVRSGKPVVHEEREPAVDVFEEDKHVLVVAEMPGIAMEDVHLELDGDRLTITAKKRDKKFHKEVELPREFTRDKMQAACNNGVLEVKLTR